PNQQILELKGTNFLLKIETLPQPKHARVFFIDKDTEEECEVPEEIK
ncbi:19460_t:CDS:1, partial [Racocetra persica]